MIYYVKAERADLSRSKMVKCEYIVDANSNTDVDCAIGIEFDSINVKPYDYSIVSVIAKEKLNRDLIIEDGSGTFYECITVDFDEVKTLSLLESVDFNGAVNLLNKDALVESIISIKKTNFIKILTIV